MSEQLPSDVSNAVYDELMDFYDGQIGRQQPIDYELLGNKTTSFADDIWEAGEARELALMKTRRLIGSISGIVFHDVHTRNSQPIAVSWLDNNVRRALHVRN